MESEKSSKSKILNYFSPIVLMAICLAALYSYWGEKKDFVPESEVVMEKMTFVSITFYEKYCRLFLQHQDDVLEFKLNSDITKRIKPIIKSHYHPTDTFLVYVNQNNIHQLVALELASNHQSERLTIMSYDDYLETTKDATDGAKSAAIAFGIMSILVWLLVFSLPNIRQNSLRKRREELMQLAGIKKVEENLYLLRVQEEDVYLSHHYKLEFREKGNYNYILISVPIKEESLFQHLTRLKSNPFVMMEKMGEFTINSRYNIYSKIKPEKLMKKVQEVVEFVREESRNFNG